MKTFGKMMIAAGVMGASVGTYMLLCKKNPEKMIKDIENEIKKMPDMMN